MPTQSVLQPDEPVTRHKSKASEDWQSQKGKPAPAGGQPSQKHKKNGKAVDPQGQGKSQNKKKSRLGQRARQQLGRAKEAGLNEGQLRKGSLVSCGCYASEQEFHPREVTDVYPCRLCVYIMHVGMAGYCRTVFASPITVAISVCMQILL